jgi:transposase
MTSITQPDRHVTGGVDTHADTHLAVVIDSATGHVAGTRQFDALEHHQLLEWMAGHGPLDRVGIEGTGSYGAGLARHLAASQVEVVDVDRPDRKTRRLRGKSDPVDAEAAARAALSGTASGTPKSRDGVVEAIRVLRVLHRSAVKDHNRAMNQFHALLLTAPEEVAAPWRGLPIAGQLQLARRLRDRPCANPVVSHTRWVLRELARRVAALDTQQADLEARLRPLVASHAPALLGRPGFGIHTTAALLVTAGDNPERMHSDAAFANLCAAAPIPASSGKTTRHRLNRGGDRAANEALWRIALVRMSHHQPTIDYVTRRTEDGKSKREIMRCLKRYIAREAFNLITNPPDDLPPDGPTLRHLRKDRGMPLHEVADAVNGHATRISELERQLKFDTDLARRVHAYITT